MQAGLAAIMGILLFAPYLLEAQHSFGQQQDGNETFMEMPIERFIPYGNNTLNVHDIGIDTSRQILFFTDSDNRALVLYDLRNNITKSVEIGPYPYAVAVNSTTDKAYVMHACNCPAGLDVTVVDYSKGIESARVEDTVVGVSRYAAPIALNPNTGRVYVGSGSGSLTVIDGSNNNEIVGRIGKSINVQGIDVNPKTNEVYVIDNATTLYKIDGATNKVVGNVTIGLPPDEVNATGNILKAIAVNPDTNVVYVINQILYGSRSPNEGVSFSTGYLVAVNGTSNAIISPDITKSSLYLTINSNTNTIYVMSGGGIVEVDGLSNDVVLRGYVPNLEEYISHLVVDESTNKLYLQGQTGIFQVSDNDNKVNAPEFHNYFVMLVPALAITAAVILTRRHSNKGH
ncbi:YncE family protein [Nitrososphaera viennensis]|uniref:YncE family protein n=1 Tax=Nitrososphaera viennensis TaxID=1034015 RepID=A0A977NMT3_9ARCH|nr:YncE family protein [Nitrososphaera viennensis]UVS69756.1 YncE family protein [Nitrososphaera viennensis]